MNDDNLVPNSQRTPSERRENARLAGIASGRARRIKARGKALVRDLLALKEPDPKVVAELERYGVNTKDITEEVAMHLRQIQKAVRTADTKAYNSVLRASGHFDDEQTGDRVVINIRGVAAASCEKWSSKGTAAQEEGDEL